VTVCVGVVSGRGSLFAVGVRCFFTSNHPAEVFPDPHPIAAHCVTVKHVSNLDTPDRQRLSAKHKTRAGHTDEQRAPESPAIAHPLVVVWVFHGEWQWCHNLDAPDRQRLSAKHKTGESVAAQPHRQTTGCCLSAHETLALAIDIEYSAR